MNSDTPRTDEAIAPLVASEMDWAEVAEKISDFARELEREVNQARECFRIVMEQSNRASEIIYQMSAHLNPNPGEHNIDAAKRVSEERDQWRKCAEDLAENLQCLLAKSETPDCKCRYCESLAQFNRLKSC